MNCSRASVGSFKKNICFNRNEFHSKAYITMHIYANKMFVFFFREFQACFREKLVFFGDSPWVERDKKVLFKRKERYKEYYRSSLSSTSLAISAQEVFHLENKLAKVVSSFVYHSVKKEKHGNSFCQLKKKIIFSRDR